MCRNLSDETLTARKPHGCNECGGTIGTGDRYHRQRNVDGGDIWTWKAHRLCAAIQFRWQHEWQLDMCDSAPDWGEMRGEIDRIFAGLCALTGHADLVAA